MAEPLTRGTVWLALLCYLTALIGWARGHARCAKLARLCWMVGCAFFLAHVVAAFHFYHQWSHTIAMEDTRRETLERTGLNFRGGLYFNYLFAVMWLIDCTGWLIGRNCFSERNKIWFIALHTFFLFMIFNATVVFGRDWAQPAGAIVCLAALMALWMQRKARRSH